MEHTSDLVYEGKHIHEHSYAQRAESGRELEISVPFEDDELFAKIDFYDSKKKIVHEIKKSDKAQKAHIWQLKFYLFVLKLLEVDANGILEYPKLRKTKEIQLSDEDIESLSVDFETIKEVVHSSSCPPLIRIPFCRSCSYHDFCWVAENE